jgi:phosphomannomutase
LWRKAQQSGPTALSQLVAPLRKYSATGEINYRVDDAKRVLQSIEEHYQKQGAWLDHLDGLTVKLDEWWFNLRSSNTEPLLRLNLEAHSRQARDQYLQEVQSLIGGEPVQGH